MAGIRLCLLGMMSLSWSLSDELGHATRCDHISQLPLGEKELNDTIINHIVSLVMTISRCYVLFFFTFLLNLLGLRLLHVKS